MNHRQEEHSEKFEPLTEDALQHWFDSCEDVHMTHYMFPDSAHDNVPGGEMLLLYCDVLVDHVQIRQFVMPLLEPTDLFPQSKISHLMLTIDEPLRQQVINLVFSGHLLLIPLGGRLMYAMDVAKKPKRTPEESNTDSSIRGPKDGFIEDLSSNIALLRSRMRTNSLCYEQFVVGRRSQTKIALVYLRDVVQPSILEEARRRLEHIDVDALMGGSHLEELLSDNPYSLLPLFDYSGRPDYALDCILHGRFLLMLEGSPNAVIAPANLMLLLKSAEDSFLPFQFVSFERLLRVAAFLTGILLVGFWVALATFHQEQIPLRLLATIMVSRNGIPLTFSLEAFLILGLFEILREAGARLPKTIGQTLAVVGGLIIGDSAIRAGLTSPSLVVIVAISTISTFVLVNQSLGGAVSLLRIFILICSAFLGLYGFLIGTCLIIMYMARLQSFGVPYLAPVSPLSFRELIPALLRQSWRKMNRRPEMMQTVDSTRQKKEGE